MVRLAKSVDLAGDTTGRTHADLEMALLNI